MWGKEGAWSPYLGGGVWSPCRGLKRGMVTLSSRRYNYTVRGKRGMTVLSRSKRISWFIDPPPFPNPSGNRQIARNTLPSPRTTYKVKLNEIAAYLAVICCDNLCLDFVVRFCCYIFVWRWLMNTEFTFDNISQIQFYIKLDLAFYVRVCIDKSHTICNCKQSRDWTIVFFQLQDNILYIKSI